MDENINKAQDAILSGINQICHKFGLNNIMAQLYAILYLHGKPASLDEMVERLEVSKGSVSVNIRALERYGAVRKIWIKGSRKDYYEAESDISKVIIDRVRSMAQGRLSEINKVVDSSYKILDASEPSGKAKKAETEIFMRRLDELKDLYLKAKSLFDLFNAGLTNNILNAKSKTNSEKEALV